MRNDFRAVFDWSSCCFTFSKQNVNTHVEIETHLSIFGLSIYSAAFCWHLMMLVFAVGLAPSAGHELEKTEVWAALEALGLVEQTGGERKVHPGCRGAWRKSAWGAGDHRWGKAVLAEVWACLRATRHRRGSPALRKDSPFSRAHGLLGRQSHLPTPALETASSLLWGSPKHSLCRCHPPVWERRRF